MDNIDFQDFFSEYSKFEKEVEESSIEEPMEFYFPKTQKTIACAVLAGMGEFTKNEFSTILSAMVIMNQAELAKQVNLALKNIDEYWNLVTYYRGEGKREAMELVKNPKHMKEEDAFGAAQYELWTSGKSFKDMGLNPMFYENEGNEDESKLDVILEDRENLLNMVYSKKIGEMSNAVDGIISCLSPTIQSQFKTPQEKFGKVSQIIDQFDAGEVKEDLDPLKYKWPKEAGVMLPQTLSPPEWLAMSTTALMEELYGDTILVAFESDSISEVRNFKGLPNEYIMFSSKEGSPYNIDVNPSIFCNELEKDGKWKWRESQDKVNAMLKTMALERNLSSGERENERNGAFRMLAEKFSKDSPIRVSWSDKGLIGRLENIEQNGEVPGGKRTILRFFKRGYSKVSQVLENDTFLHIVSDASARELETSPYEAITLPDFNSVVLIPDYLWNVSPYSRGARKFATSLGTTRYTGDMSVVRLYTALHCLSHTMKMFSNWKEHKPYSYLDHGTMLFKMAATKGTYRGIFKSPLDRDPGKRRDFMSLLNNVIPGNYKGLLIAARPSKIGKRSANNLGAHSQFAHDMGEYAYGKDIGKREEEVDFSSYFLDHGHQGNDESSEEKDPPEEFVYQEEYQEMSQDKVMSEEEEKDEVGDVGVEKWAEIASYYENFQGSDEDKAMEEFNSV